MIHSLHYILMIVYRSVFRLLSGRAREIGRRLLIALAQKKMAITRYYDQTP